MWTNISPGPPLRWHNIFPGSQPFWWYMCTYPIQIVKSIELEDHNLSKTAEGLA